MAEERETDGDVLTASKEQVKTKPPRPYQVVLCNDDYTTMEFVVFVLEQIFGKSPAEAVEIMLKVHRQGRGIAGIYSREIAEAKVALVHKRARDAGYPLLCLVEPAA